MKKCPYCAEEIQDEAIKCRYCGEFILKVQPEKWYFKTSWLVIGFLFIGPFVLPLFWLNPRFNIKTKIIISVLVVVATYFLMVFTVNAFKTIGDYYEQIFQALNDV